MLVDNLEFAVKNIRKRVMRSSLTILGISIGIMGIVGIIIAYAYLRGRRDKTTQ